MLPKELLGGDLKEGPVIGSGPFIMGDWEKGKSTQMKRNPDYYDKGKPFLDGVQYFPATRTDATSAIVAISVLASASTASAAAGRRSMTRHL